MKRHRLHKRYGQARRKRIVPDRADMIAALGLESERQ